MALLVECKKCGHRFDPNDDETKWAPPMSKESSDLGSLICPGCSNRADFSEYKAITSAKT